MAYQLTTLGTIRRLSDDALIPVDPENRDYAAYLAWVAEGNTADPAPAVSEAPNYAGFYDALLVSAAYQKVRAQAQESLPLTLAAVEFVAAMGDAKAGRPNVPALQACLTNIASAATDLDAADWSEIGTLLAANGLGDVFELPGSDSPA